MTLIAERLKASHNRLDDFRAAIWEEVQRALPRAVRLCRELAAQARDSREVQFRIIPPKQDPDLTRQVTALLGVDRYRQLIEEDTEMCFGLGGCCGAVAAPLREQVDGWLTWEKQFELQTTHQFMC